jgi:hypothetical protein
MRRRRESRVATCGKEERGVSTEKLARVKVASATMVVEIALLLLLHQQGVQFSAQPFSQQLQSLHHLHLQLLEVGTRIERFVSRQEIVLAAALLSKNAYASMP